MHRVLLRFFKIYSISINGNKRNLQSAALHKFIHRFFASLPTIVVVDDNIAALNHAVKKVFQNASSGFVPVGIHAKQCDGANLLFCGGKSVLEPTLFNADTVSPQAADAKKKPLNVLQGTHALPD